MNEYESKDLHESLRIAEKVLADAMIVPDEPIESMDEVIEQLDSKFLDIFSDVETKDVVRKPEYWNAPYGTPITPGMRAALRARKAGGKKPSGRATRARSTTQRSSNSRMHGTPVWTDTLRTKPANQRPRWKFNGEPHVPDSRNFPKEPNTGFAHMPISEVPVGSQVHLFGTGKLEKVGSPVDTGNGDVYGRVWDSKLREWVRIDPKHKVPVATIPHGKSTHKNWQNSSLHKKAKVNNWQFNGEPHTPEPDNFPYQDGYTLMPICELPVGSYIRDDGDEREYRVGSPVDNGNGDVVGRYYDGQQWVYVGPTTRMKVYSIPRGKLTSSTWKKSSLHTPSE